MLAFLVLLAVPVAIGVYKVWKYHRGVAAAKAWAEAELEKPKPDPLAYGVLGGIALDQGRLDEALPLLAMAVKVEAARGESAQDHLTFAKAHIEGSKKGLPGAGREAALKALEAAQGLASKLPQGRAAATWFGVGLQYRSLGEKQRAIACFSKAAELQPDDWVDEGPGKRYKKRGIASYYQKVLAGAEMQ